MQRSILSNPLKTRNLLTETGVGGVGGPSYITERQPLLLELSRQPVPSAPMLALPASSWTVSKGLGLRDQAGRNCSTGKMCTLAKTRGLYVSEKSANRLLKDCEKSEILIEGENAVLEGRRKARNLHIEVVQKCELRPT